MDGEGWTPRQRDRMERVFGRTEGFVPVRPFPALDPALALRFTKQLETGLEDVAEGFSREELLSINKHDLSSVFKCEGLYLAESAAFEWATQKAVGTVVGRAMTAMLTPFARGLAPMELVDQAFQAIIREGKSLALYVQECGAVERAELAAEATDRLTKFQTDFPQVSPRWIPRIECPVLVPLCEGRIQLRGKYDLALGRPGITPSEVVVVDFKSGAERSEHRDDARFYALLETLRNEVPPFRVASYYLDSGESRAEDVDEGVLEAAVRRTIDGARRIADMRQSARTPHLTPGGYCTFCTALPECPVGREWIRSG